MKNLVMCWAHIQSFAVSFPTIESLYPGAMCDLEQGLQMCQPISDQNFQNSKQQICEFVELSSRTVELDHLIREQLLSLVAERGLQSAKGFLDVNCRGSGSSKKTESGLWGRAKTLVSGILSKADEENYIVTPVPQRTVKETATAAQKISDCQFLSDIVKRKIVQTSKLSQLAEEAQARAISYLGSTISSLVDKIVLSAQRNREERCITDINVEISNLEKTEQLKERSQFIHQVNRASYQDGNV